MNRRLSDIGLFCCLVGISLFVVPTPTWAQATQDRLAAASKTQQEPARVLQNDLMVQSEPLVLRTEAYAGTPYGVGKLTFRLRRGDELISRVGATLLTESQGRVFYPVHTRSAVNTFVETLTGNRGTQPDEVQTLWFLFVGDAPLDLTLHGSGSVRFNVPVESSRPRQFTRQARQWWQSYTRYISNQVKASDYPPIVETYLMSMLGRRLQLDVPNPFRRDKDPLMETFELMFDVERLRSDTIRQSMLYGADSMVADQPVPPPIQWTPVVVLNLPEKIEIEPIARAVPEECFYLRFGTWDNQVWMQRLLDEFGGDLGRMIQVRGFKQKIQTKFLSQLAIESSEFDNLFGGSLISDVAVIGNDTHFDDGAGVGVLLYSQSSKALKNNLSGKRKSFARAHKKEDCTIEQIQVGDVTVDFLSSPDNRYRSFYVVAGDYHLMTTSYTMAKRFLEACDGVGSLADSKEYRFARYNMPLEREDTVFVYMSTKFFQGLLSPQYQIELRRRNRIVTDMMMVELAQLAATNEGHQDLDTEGMIREGYLPVGFGSRPDGGSFHTNGENWFDSIRGRRGFFAPILDLPIKEVTSQEFTWFQERAVFFADSIGSLDPMFVAIKRYQHHDKVERVVFDARVAPFGEKKYGWMMSMLGPPITNEVAKSPKDIMRLQASMRGGTLSPDVVPHQVFAAVHDRLDPNVDLRPDSFLQAMETLRETPGYLGAWPSPGYTDWLPALGQQPDAMGFTYSRLLRVWKLQWDGFSVLSFDRDRLEKLKPHLKVSEAERPAQIRLEVGDLARSNLRGWANSLSYRRSWQTSVSNVKLLNLLTQQFRAEPETTREIVERMLDVELVCSLRGKYQLVELANGRKMWISDSWPSFSHPVLPDDHTSPLLQWFRGLVLEVTKGPSQFSVHGFLDIERSELGGALPSFEMFQGFGNLFGSGQGKKKDGSAPK